MSLIWVQCERSSLNWIESKALKSMAEPSSKNNNALRGTLKIIIDQSNVQRTVKCFAKECVHFKVIGNVHFNPWKVKK